MHGKTDLQRKRGKSRCSREAQTKELTAGFPPTSWFLTLPKPRGLPGDPGHLRFLLKSPNFAYVNFFKVQFTEPCHGGVHPINAAVQLPMKLFSPAAGGALVPHGLVNFGLPYPFFFRLVL